MDMKRNAQLRLIMDIIDNIKKVKKKKLDQELIIRDAETHLGLNATDSKSLIEELLSRKILCCEDESIEIDFKRRFDLTKSLLDSFHDISLPSLEGQNLSTSETQTTADETGNWCQLANDIIDFKKFVHGEILSMKAMVSSRSPSDECGPPGPPPSRPPIDYEKFFIRSLEDRILSLEKQLDHKQKTIEKLMENQNVMADNVEKGKFETPVCISNSNEDVQTKAPKNRNNGKNSKKNDSNEKNDTNQDQTDLANRHATPIVYASIDVEKPVVQTVAKKENRRSRRLNKQKQSAEPKISQTQDANQAQNNSETIQVPDSDQASINAPPVVTDDGKPKIPMNATKQAASQPPNNDNISSNDDMNAAAAAPEMTYFAKKRSTTEILGDSMVKGIQGFKMKEAVRHKENVFVRSFPGANIDAMNSYVCPAMKKSPSRIILHCGTNDLNTNQSPWTIAEDIIELAKAMENKDTEVLVSSIVQRRDKLNGKALEVNKALERECERMRLGFIDNSNIDPESHLNGSGLHLNMEGTIILANNFIRAMGY